MRIATGLVTVLAGIVLTFITLGSASSLPRVAEGTTLASGASLAEPVASRRAKKVYRYRTERPYYVPYFCSHPYQYRYWQFYAPICYPINRPLPQYKR
jgi:hypothetical protein